MREIRTNKHRLRLSGQVEIVSENATTRNEA
jgi:hypothetical protein